MNATATQTPAQIDAQLADIWEKQAKATRQAQHEQASLERVVKSGRENLYGRTANDIKAQIAKLSETMSELDAQAAPLNAEYADRRWSRFFIVRGKDGHIHSSMDCSTCNNGRQATQFGWLPELSGQTEAQAVAEQGAILCTVCFPSAPVEWTNGHELAEQAKKAGQCSGSGKSYDPSLPHRKGFYSGNWATCPDCGEGVTLTKGMKLRAHKTK